MRDSEYILTHLESQSLIQRRVRTEYLIKIDFEDRVSGNVRSLLVKSSMNVDVMLYHEADMSKSIDVGQFVPIR
jgi:hypothetical protein